MILAEFPTRRNNLRSYFPNFNTENGGLFKEMPQLLSLLSGRSLAEGQVVNDMDIAYFSMYSGIKEPSEFVILNSVDGIADNSAIARILWTIYGEPWTHLFNAFVEQYDPIDNYNITESTARDQTDARTINRTEDNTGTASSTANEIGLATESGTSTVQHGHQIKTDGEVDSFTHAFNSADKVPTGVQIETQTQVNSGSDVTTTSNKTDTTNDTTTSANTTDKTTENTTDNNKTNETIERTRKGNVGQNSYQELLQQEFNLWKWNFYKQVFEDVDKFLVLSVFDPCSLVNL